ncbi:hypothetical protein BDF20DRAFT_839311 [Mycotypha africana]|uniref:uncharacterized protein n=1 Tax=Mycotypha africana TaxID=64632 RepID=UPI0022FFC9C5|nr:uncharacterized protein BDF20DRAFT_839311 [Mycotypha africana]KAI8968189.1 hypothetical protein BDF20DRAFT_839311 [Mycotypha africana]
MGVLMSDFSKLHVKLLPNARYFHAHLPLVILFSVLFIGMLSKEEHDTAVKQRCWLLEDVIPNVLNELKAQLEELQIKVSSYHQDHLIKAAINSDMPYFLEQAKQASNYLSLASNRLKSFVTPSYKQATIAFLEDMYQYIDRALHAFDYPSEAALFPYKVCHPKFFSPPLKQDLVIEFCVRDIYIACNIYALDYNFLKHGHSKTASEERAFVTYKDKPVMILETVKTQAQSPMLTEFKTLTKSILEQCQTYKQMLLQIEA